MPTFPGSSPSNPYEDDSEEEETMPAFARSWMVSTEAGSLSPVTGCWEKCQLFLRREIHVFIGGKTHRFDPSPRSPNTGVFLDRRDHVVYELCKIKTQDISTAGFLQLRGLLEGYAVPWGARRSLFAQYRRLSIQLT